MKRQAQLFFLLLRPSQLSFTVCAIVSGALLASANWVYLQEDVLHDYLFAQYGLVTVLQESPNGFTDMFRLLFSSSLLREALSFLFIVCLGAIVYVLLQGARRAVSDARGTWSDLHGAESQAGLRPQLHRSLLGRVATRTLVLTVWLVYALVFLKILLPFSVLTFRYGTGLYPNAVGWWYMFLGLALLAIALHLHVCFMRLLALRPRLFGEAEAFIEAERQNWPQT